MVTMQILKSIFTAHPDFETAATPPIETNGFGTFQAYYDFDQTNPDIHLALIAQLNDQERLTAPFVQLQFKTKEQAIEVLQKIEEDLMNYAKLFTGVQTGRGGFSLNEDQIQSFKTNTFKAVIQDSFLNGYAWYR